MENNNYNSGSNRNEAENTSNVTNTETNSTNSTNSGQTESGSTYSYSYLNQEQKNPNNIWRADENTAGAGAGSSSYNGTQQSSGQGAYSSTQYGTDGAQHYTNGTDSGYGSTQNGTDSGYGYTQNTGYGSQQSGSMQNDANMYGAYGSTQNSAYGSTQSSSYSNSQTGTYGSAQNGANAYSSTQSGADGSGSSTGADHQYSNIYGTPNGQAGWNTYSDAKKQKKEERARKREAAKAAGTHANFGVKLAKCASLALVFGLVAGTAFEGSGYVAGNLFGTNNSEAGAVPGEDREVLKTNENDNRQNTTPMSNVENDVVSIVEESMPSIVSITNMSQVQYQNWFGQVQNYEIPSAGSGIIVSEDNDYLYIATNNHVVASTTNAAGSTTTLSIQFCDNTTVAAEIKGTDASTDLAVVQVKKSELEPETLSAIKVATLGDSDAMKVGSRAIAIGNALGYGQSVTVGYISAVDREVTMEDESTNQTYTNSLIQTDAAINPGNSGGALLNTNGEVIGINSSKYSDTTVEGMGFAIPSNMAKPIIEDLITREEVTEDKAAYLGISGASVTSSVSNAYNMPEGVFIKQVIDGTAAQQYGIQQGDILTKFDGKEIKSMETLQKRLAYYEAGTEVEIVLQRPQEGGYEEVTVSVVLGKKN